jgi:glycosyltransferase involved in cell wall biosynthesis
MTQPAAFFLAPEAPSLQAGGGGVRAASLLEYLRAKYQVAVAGFTLPRHCGGAPARLGRNAVRWLRGRPPLLDRYSGFEDQVQRQIRGHYRLAVIEHFWCAPYAAALRPHADVLVLDLHNVESALARSHARAVRGLEAAAFRRFAAAYERLEREWLPRFDVVLAASDEDRERVHHPKVAVYPNALPEVPAPDVPESNCIVFSGNLEYHPNIAAVRWFRSAIWPRIRARIPGLEWRLVGRNPHSIARVVDGDDRIRVTGPVVDAIAELAAAKLCVVPLLSGSGTRFKILEAWAAGRAVVSTSLGAEGLGARPGEHLLIADDPASFASAVIEALETRELRRRLGANGRALYQQRFTWPAAWRALEDLL